MKYFFTLQKLENLNLEGFRHFSAFLHHFVFAKLATSSIRVKYVILRPDDQIIVPELSLLMDKSIIPSNAETFIQRTRKNAGRGLVPHPE